jgi:hypothetical protein
MEIDRSGAKRQPRLTSGPWRFFRVLAAAAVGCLLVVGCSSSHSASSTTTSKSSGGSFSVDTPGGSVSISLDGQLPAGWPAGFPLPPGATPAGSGSVSNGNGSHQVAVFQVPGTGLQAFDFYKQSDTLTVSGPKSGGSGSQFVGSLTFSGPYTGNVTVIDVGSRTLVVVNLTS